MKATELNNSDIEIIELALNDLLEENYNNTDIHNAIFITCTKINEIKEFGKVKYTGDVEYKFPIYCENCYTAKAINGKHCEECQKEFGG